MKYRFIGKPEVIQEKINEVEDLGVEKIVIVVESPELEDPLNIFSRDIMWL